MRGRRAAAAADHRGTGLHELRDVPGEFVRTEGEDRASADERREPRVGLHNDRFRRELRKPFHLRQHPVRTESAVEAVRIDAERLEERRNALDRSAREELAVRIDCDRRPDRQVAGLLRGEDGGLQLKDVAHRLDDDQVRCR